MGLDIRTLIFVAGIMHVMQVVVFIHQYLINKTCRGIGWWLLWSAAEVAGFTFMLLRNIPSMHAVAIVAQNALIVLGVLFIYVGIMRFYGKKESRALVVSIFAVFISSLLYFLFALDDIQVRSVIIFSTLSTCSFLSAQALLAHRTRVLSASANFLAATFVIHGLYHAFRVLRWFSGVPFDEVFAPTLMNATAYLDAIIAGTIWTFGFIIMINQRLLSETAEAKDEIERIFSICPDAITVTRLSDGLIVKVNEGFSVVSGFTRGEVLGKTGTQINIWKNPDDRQMVISELVEKGVSENVEVVFQHKNGRQIFGLLSAKIIYLKDVQHVISITRDITAHKQAEAELQKMQNLKSVGTLAGGIAHDFNNILQGLYGNVSLAKDDLHKNHPAYAALEEAENSMERAVRLTSKLLTFAKGGDPVKVDVSLGTLTENTARQDLQGNSICLVFTRAEDLWPVKADKGQIRQVISNLTVNACQSMPEGGHLYITVENAEIQAAAIAGLAQGRYVKVTVRDEGHGIAPALLGQIFDPYFTTRQNGRGLGLAMVWSIINRHGGHIGVVSEVGKGSTFTFYLPAAAAQQQAEMEPSAVDCHAPATPRPSKILMMDDEEQICRLAVRMLRPCGYSVTTVSGGREAIALYKRALEAGEPFDAVILDLTIPGGIGGKETVEALLALDPNVRAIVCSGYADDPVMANATAYGFKSAVAKPYTISRLREVVARVVK